MTSRVGTKRERQRAMRELIARSPVTSQDELVAGLAARGYAVTQATVSRDIAELGLVKIARGSRHVYVAPEDLAAAPAPPSSRDDRLRRILADIPVSVRRSGLILLLVGSPGTASVVAQAIDDSSLDEQEGTIAGDDTLLVLFADEVRLSRWLHRFREVQGLPPLPSSSLPVGGDLASLSSTTSTEAPR